MFHRKKPRKNLRGFFTGSLVLQLFSANLQIYGLTNLPPTTSKRLNTTHYTLNNHNEGQKKALNLFVVFILFSLLCSVNVTA